MGNKTNHPRKYVFWSDWEAWRLKEWFPFKEKFENDLPHMQKDIADTKRDISWLKRIMVGVLIAIVAGAIAVILTS